MRRILIGLAALIFASCVGGCATTDCDAANRAANEAIQSVWPHGVPSEEAEGGACSDSDDAYVLYSGRDLTEAQVDSALDALQSGGWTERHIEVDRDLRIWELESDGHAFRAYVVQSADVSSFAISIDE